MKVLLVLNKTLEKECRVVVSLNKRSLKEKVEELLREEKGQEAFNLLYSQAEVDSYLPPGTKPLQQPDLILIEDML